MFWGIVNLKCVGRRGCGLFPKRVSFFAGRDGGKATETAVDKSLS